ncbi:hypothetical protein LCGC14_2135080 [marine sediment metagenome]|uniref:Uncharacterized protein n=1 Tax=marine sediment metagenome TaxID=412755 RepID=A0A0F9GWE9_9ZZZZ
MMKTKMSKENHLDQEENGFFTVCTDDRTQPKERGDVTLVYKEVKEVENARDTVIEALELAYSAWKHKVIRNTPNMDTLRMVDKTHTLVINYINAMLGDKDTIPLAGM